MFVSDNLSINEKNHLVIGKSDTVKLAEKYGTPLYVLDDDLFRKNCRIYKQAIEKFYEGNGLALYASKALCCIHVCKTAAEEGLGLDVVSGGELYTAIKAGFPMDKVYFHGNNKTPDEIELAVKSGVSHIIVDNIYELEKINETAKHEGVIQKIMFRIKPGIDAHTHDFIRTGQIDSKFGVALENGEAFEIIKHAMKLENVKVDGVHCHIGSQIFDIDPFCLAAEVMMNFIGDLKDKLGLEIEKLNLGGGFGIKYVESDDPIPYDKYIQSVSEVIKSTASKRNVKVPFILMEPGRSISAPAGITLYTVGGIKDIKNVRKYVSVDGGMGDNPRYILYGSKYSAVAANHASDPYDEVVTVAGKCCESGDIILENEKLQKLNVGDTLAVLATGAYNYSMASNYNRIPRPAIVAVSDGNDKIIVKRETYDDIIMNDVE
ncbi:MAG: diaminopimelate decarboxylase [Clostridia bacterium]|nr:diaminopimelate decarboxylase [Clostridia bacterium]